MMEKITKPNQNFRQQSNKSDKSDKQTKESVGFILKVFCFSFHNKGKFCPQVFPALSVTFSQNVQLVNTQYIPAPTHKNQYLRVNDNICQTLGLQHQEFFSSKCLSNSSQCNNTSIDSLPHNMLLHNSINSRCQF